MKDPRQVIIQPCVTEKSTHLIERTNKKGVAQNTYSFRVDPKSRKPEIRQAIESLFGVKVRAVNIIWKRGKIRSTRKGGSTRTSDWKKALVTLREGYKIELY